MRDKSFMINVREMVEVRKTLTKQKKYSQNWKIEICSFSSISAFDQMKTKIDLNMRWDGHFQMKYKTKTIAQPKIKYH